MLRFDCPMDGCTFTVRGATEYEVFDAVYEHATAVHDTTLSGSAIHERLVEVD